MKKTLLTILAATMTATAAYCFPKAIYVKSGNTYLKYNFGVAADLKFSNDGKTLRITGYNEAIDLDKIDWISFNAPVDDSSLTPSQQKQKLIDVAEEFNSKVSIHDHEDIVRMIDRYTYEFIDYDFDEDLFDVNSRRELKDLIGLTGKIAKGDLQAAREWRTRALDIYSLADYTGVFQVNTRTEEWERVANADYLEFRYPAEDMDYYYVRITHKNGNQSVTEDDVKIIIPDEVVITGLKGKTELFKARLDNTVDRDQKIVDILFHFVAGEYVVDDVFRVRDSYLSDDVTLTVKGETLLTANAKINGTRLLDVDNWKEEVENSTENDWYYDPVTGDYVEINGNLDNNIVSHFINGVTDVDLLGKLQAKAKMSALSKIYDILETDDYYDNSKMVIDKDKRVIYRYYNDPDIVDKKVSTLNNYSDASFYYDGNNILQGYFLFDMDEDVDEYHSDGYWDEKANEYVNFSHTAKHIDYEIMPLLVFPDLTSFAITDYFNETNFSKLITDYEDLIDSFHKVVGRR